MQTRNQIEYPASFRHRVAAERQGGHQQQRMKYKRTDGNSKRQDTVIDDGREAGKQNKARNQNKSMHTHTRKQTSATATTTIANQSRWQRGIRQERNGRAQAQTTRNTNLSNKTTRKRRAPTQATTSTSKHLSLIHI